MFTSQEKNKICQNLYKLNLPIRRFEVTMKDYLFACQYIDKTYGVIYYLARSIAKDIKYALIKLNLFNEKADPFSMIIYDKIKSLKHFEYYVPYEYLEDNKKYFKIEKFYKLNFETCINCWRIANNKKCIRKRESKLCKICIQQKKIIMILFQDSNSYISKLPKNILIYQILKLIF